jgi:beta-glucosidase
LWDEAFTKLEDAVSLGLVDESVIDEAVLRVLALKFKRGLFESPFLDESVPVCSLNIEDYPQSLELARQSIVLLKNKNNLLPLSQGIRKVAVIGPAADDLYLQLGDYTPPVQADFCITLWSGLQKLAPSAVELVYTPGCGLRDGSQKTIDEAVELAKKSNLVILALGGSSSRYSGARFDVNGAVIHDGDVYMDCGEGVDNASLRLPGIQNDLAKAIFDTGTPVITVIIAGRPYAVPDIDCESDALVYAFYPGPWGGKAIAELLFGITNPSGRLPASLPRSSGQLPCYYNRKATDLEQQYCDLSAAPLYPFGYGLSFTTFEICSVRVQSGESGTVVSVIFDIKNTGEYGGYAVPMLFIRWLQGDITPRAKELKAFTKVWLEPGQNKEVTLELVSASLSRWDKDMNFVPGKGRLRLILEEGGTLFWQEEILR